MKLSSIKAPKGSRRKKKRLGMGPGSGTGKTSGKGHKGQNSRSGGGVKPWFEGGQMPLQMRLPKIGFNSTSPDNQVLNVSDLARKELSGEVTIEVLKKSGLISSLNKPVKILGVGDLTHSLQVQEGIKVSASAFEKIVRAGGSVVGAETMEVTVSSEAALPGAEPASTPEETDETPSEDDDDDGEDV